MTELNMELAATREGKSNAKSFWFDQWNWWLSVHSLTWWFSVCLYLFTCNTYSISLSTPLSVHHSAIWMPFNLQLLASTAGSYSDQSQCSYHFKIVADRCAQIRQSDSENCGIYITICLHHKSAHLPIVLSHLYTHDLYQVYEELPLTKI